MRAGWREGWLFCVGGAQQGAKADTYRSTWRWREECCKPVHLHQISSLILLTALGSGEPARYRSPAGVTVPDRHRGPEFFHVRGKVKIWDVHFWRPFWGVWNSNIDAFILGFIFRILTVSSWSCVNLPILTLRSEFCTFVVTHQALALNSELGFHGFSSELFR